MVPFLLQYFGNSGDGNTDLNWPKNGQFAPFQGEKC